MPPTSLLPLWLFGCGGAPSPIIDAEPVSGPAPLLVTLDGSGSGGEGLHLAWDLGDGASAEGELVTHTFLWADTFQVVLTATDPSGRSREAWIDVEVTAPSCPELGGPLGLGAVESSDLTEASGLVASRAHPGVLWSHNDSGDAGRLFAMSESGGDLGVYTLSGAEPRDAEDLALGPAPDLEADALFLADIGDNALSRGYLRVYLAPEPDPAAPGGALPSLALELAYPDGPHDAESFFVDPVDGRMYIVTKATSGAGVYATPPSFDPDARIALERVAHLPTLTGSPVATGADLTPLGERVVVRTYTHAWIWWRDVRDPLADAFGRPPCELSLEPEAQGEAVAWGPDGGLYTVSEGEHPTIWSYPAEYP